MKSFLLLPLCILFISAKSSDHQKVTCGSAIKLTHEPTGFKLHSHDIAYGSGSRQQSVTGFPDKDDSNSLFIVKRAYGQPDCTRGEAIDCNSQIRLQHLNSQKFLHSHLHQAPLSQGQEVSAFDEVNIGDNWKLECLGKEKVWLRDEKVRLSHGETGKYLHANKDVQFRNPIPGQLEISAVSSASKNTIWMAQEGIYFSDNPQFA